MPQIPTDLMNRTTADEMRFLMTERAFRWNKMRRTRICYNAVPSSKHGKDIVPDEEVTPELENEVLEALKWWIIDDVYWYFRECVESMGIGVYLDIDYKNISSSSTEVLDRSNNALNIHFSSYLLMLSHPPSYAISLPNVPGSSAWTWWRLYTPAWKKTGTGSACAQHRHSVSKMQQSCSTS